ncbi:hypothetical protein THAR02_09372 [Trichoderma harzianum]|uniref:Major facilitator superfamily (MFS) profile domain-containing protein n=1 Tax=Trichoderma harzianum TaxID=5544 RepID=A0A0F9X1I0_TRIHA|nr:hypothetical protein THAR02_09372 [Trichoderma harzianum]
MKANQLGSRKKCTLTDVQSAVIETFEDISQLAWLGAGFTLGSVAVILPYGALYSMFSLKYLYIAGVVLFELGPVLCGAAPSMSLLIVGRVIAGMGGTGLYLGGTYISGIGFVWGVGACLGPVIGGLFSVSKATWRWGFYIKLVIGAATAPIYIFNLPNVHPVREISLRYRVKSIDYVGSVLSSGLWVAFSLAFVFAGDAWRWQDGRTIATIIVFGLLTILYMVQQYIVSALHRRLARFPSICFGRGRRFLQPSALRPLIRHSTYRRIIITVGGSLLYVYLKPETPTASIYGISVVLAVGTGLTMQIGYAVATLKVTPEDVAKSLSMQNVNQMGGTTIALIIAVLVFESAAVRNVSGVLEGKGFSDEQIRAVIAGAQSTLFEHLSNDMKMKVILAITEAMQTPFILVIVSGAVVVVSSFAMKREKLFGEIVAGG